MLALDLAGNARFRSAFKSKKSGVLIIATNLATLSFIYFFAQLQIQSLAKALFL
jgi:hypothetical protein